MRILVTGGAGFVGSHLVDRLMLDGHLVTVVDNLSTGAKSNISHWVNHVNFNFIQHDVRMPLKLDKVFDRIYHLACPASPKHYQRDQKGTLKTCFFGTLNTLTLASTCKARLLFASTSEVYGDPLVHPQPESYKGNTGTTGPRACYDEGKRAAETLCYTYRDQVDVRVARIFNTYGPRMSRDDGRVVSTFILSTLDGRGVCVYGDGMQTRSFQYIDDLVDGLVALMEHSPANDTEDMLIVNIGNPEERTILDLAHSIHSLVKPTPIIHTPAAIDDPQRRKPDISKARNMLRWEPKVTLDEGLKRTIEYFRK